MNALLGRPGGRGSSSREARTLANLSDTASTSRVLNLALIYQINSQDPDYVATPFFKDKGLNKSLLIKHSLRGNERDLFTRTQRTATKLLLPFDADDLSLGGRSIFVNQIGFEAFARTHLNLGTAEGQRDLSILKLLDQIPSLDPFLVREQLARHDFRPAPCYLKISPSDLAAMVHFTNEEIKRLVLSAFGEGMEGAAAKLTSKILANTLDNDLDPLRQTFRMSDAEFAEGMFSWRGFLYFKWRQDSLIDDIRTMLRGLATFRPIGPSDSDTRAYMEDARPRIARLVLDAVAAAKRTLQSYDHAYNALVEGADPGPFRRFLLDGPRMFFELGENIGVLAHIGSFWRYRMGDGRRPVRLGPLEFAEMLIDFEDSLTNITPPSDSLDPPPIQPTQQI